MNTVLEKIEALKNAIINKDWFQSDFEGWEGKLIVVLNSLLPIEVSDITKLTDEQLDSLEVGGMVAKKTGTAKHLYIVSYKDAENGGLCLTYTDASTVETVSYDHTESGWAYNSTDVTHIGG